MPTLQMSAASPQHCFLVDSLSAASDANKNLRKYKLLGLFPSSSSFLCLVVICKVFQVLSPQYFDFQFASFYAEVLLSNHSELLDRVIRNELRNFLRSNCHSNYQCCGASFQGFHRTFTRFDCNSSVRTVHYPLPEGSSHIKMTERLVRNFEKNTKKKN